MDSQENALYPVKFDKKWGYKNIYGELVLQYTWEEARDFSEDLAAVKVKGKWGYIDRTGNFVIQPRYNDATKFSEGLAAVSVRIPNDGERYGYIDHTGKLVIPFTWRHYAHPFREGMAVVKAAGRSCGYIDKTGKVVVPCVWDDAYDFENGLGRVIKEGFVFNTTHYFNKDGEMVK